MAAEPLVGIFGAGRNGSSLLARLIDGSPDLWIHPIDVVFLPLWDDLAAGFTEIRGASYRTATTRLLRHVEKPIARDDAWKVWKALVDDVEQTYAANLETPLTLRQAELESLGGSELVTAAEWIPEFLEASYRATTRNPDAPRPKLLGFKTSETAYVDDFLRIWPELRCVHIVREPHANYRPVKRTWIERKLRPFWSGGGAEDHLQTFIEARWVPHARAALQHVAADPDRHVLVRYEDLVADPIAEVSRVCDRLGIRPPKEPSRQTVLGGERVRRWPDNPSKAGVATPDVVVPNMAERFAYEEVLTTRERDLLTHKTGELARALGYETPPAPRALGLWLRWLPIDRSERQYATKRLLYEVLKRRVYLTRAIFSR